MPGPHANKTKQRAKALRKYSHNSPAGWKKSRKYGGSNAGGASIGGSASG